MRRLLRCISCCSDRRPVVTDVLFLPGIIAPATIRYAPLLAELPGVRGVPKDLEVYRDDAPPEDYSISTEIDGVDRAAHLHTSHQAQPERVAAALRGLWRRAERRDG
jgi:hypothetical protein